MNGTKKSIKYKFFILFIICGLIPVIVQAVLVNSVYVKKIEKTYSETSVLVLEKLSSDTELIVEKMLDVSNMCVNDETIQNSIVNSFEDDAAIDQIYFTLADEIALILKKVDLLVNIIIMDKNGRVYSNSVFGEKNEREIKQGIESDQWYKDSFKQQTGSIWLGISRNYTQLGSSEVFYLARHMVLEGRYIATVLVSIDRYILDKLFNMVKINDNNEIYIANKENEILYISDNSDRFIEIPFSQNASAILKGPDKSQSINTVISYEREKYLLSSCGMYSLGWSLISITPERSIVSEIEYLKIIPIFLTLFTLVMSAFFIFKLNKNVVNPIIELSGVMKSIQKGNLKSSASEKYTYEIGELANGFNKMIGDINLYISKVKEDEQQKRKLEFKVLESQIKPHFLYNTLNSIKWMAEMQSASGVSEAISALVSLTEFNIDAKSKMVKISQEVEALRNYTHLQQLRYGNCFDASFKIDKNVEDLYMIKLLLQPIVENSIKHGVSEINDKGTIDISAALSGNDVIFEVKDNGPGFDEAFMQKLINEDIKIEGRKGMGLKNVQKRIKISYGEKYGIFVESMEGKGTKVIIVIPAINEENQAVEEK